MIQPNELRIGNYVSYPFGGMQKIRNGEDIDNIYEAAGDPIPLTPELLEKCGYIKDSTDKRFYNPGTSLPPLYFIQSGYYYMVGLPLNGNKFKNLHQLQNLIFALTGEELEIKL